MRGTIQTTLRWMWTYAHVMIKSGTPARAADIAEFGAAVTTSCGDVVAETGLKVMPVLASSGDTK
jgi:hypothetical protein